MDNADTQGLAAALFLLGIYKVTDLIENEMARSSVLHEMIVTAVEQDYLEQRANGAVVLQTLVAERRATQRAQAEERAAVAERKQAEAEAKLAASQACPSRCTPCLVKSDNSPLETFCPGRPFEPSFSPLRGLLLCSTIRYVLPAA